MAKGTLYTADIQTHGNWYTTVLKFAIFHACDMKYISTRLNLTFNHYIVARDNDMEATHETFLITIAMIKHIRRDGVQPDKAFTQVEIR